MYKKLTEKDHKFPVWVRGNATSVSDYVHVSLCRLSLCLFAYLKNHASKLHLIFLCMLPVAVALYFSDDSASVQYIMFFRFCEQEAFEKMLGLFATASRRTPPVLHCHSPGVATVAHRLHIDVHNNVDNNDNA